MTSRSYKHGGKAHQTLLRLDKGPATLAQLRYACDVYESANRRRKHWYVLQALLAEGLVTEFGDGFQITEEGRAKLIELDDAPGAPSVRIFARSAA